MTATNVLVTGGCGFIGRALCARLHGAGRRVAILDDFSVGAPADAHGLFPHRAAEAGPGQWTDGAVAIVRGDILDADTVARAAQGAGAIVHLAANTGVPKSIDNPRMDCVTNVVGTLNVLEAARAIEGARVVFASSGAPVGEVTPPIHEEVVPHPISPYGASKLAGEAYCHAYWRSYGVDAVALRFGNVYGPGSFRKSSVVATFCQAILAGRPLVINGDGRQTRDFIDVGDLVDAILAALDRPGIGGETFQIATSHETSVGEVAERLAAIAEEMGLPRPELRRAEHRHGDVLRNFSDTSKAARMLGWTARISLDDGLRRVLRDFVDGAGGAALPGCLSAEGRRYGAGGG